MKTPQTHYSIGRHLMLTLIVALLLVGATYAAAQYRLTLVNEDWEVVTVEVREGNQNSCSDRDYVGQKTLYEGQSWGGIACGRPCWRKKLPGHGWGSWVTTTCFFESETHSID